MRLLISEHPEDVERLLISSEGIEEFLNSANDFLRSRLLTMKQGGASEAGVNFVRGLFRELTWMRQYYERNQQLPPVLSSSEFDESHEKTSESEEVESLLPIESAL